MKNRMNVLREQMKAAGVDGLLITTFVSGHEAGLVHTRYLTGFTGSTAILLVLPDGAKIFVDPRYWVQAEQQVHGADVVKCSASLAKEATEALQSLGLRRLGIEANHMTVSERDSWAASLPAVEIVPTKGLIERMRLVKDEDEIAAIRRACALVDDLFQHIQGFIKPGVREIDVALELEFQMRKRGAEAVGFPSIIASGVNGAKPHAGASDKPIEDGDFVTMDYGARVDGYNSDITRTVAVGHVTDKQREVYEVVRRAQQAAVDALRPGIGYVEADKVARDIIGQAGYGEYFGHGLGHSLGMEVHDGARLSPAADPEGRVQAGEVWTVEPGIYIPGWGGVRIEDDVLVTENGHEVLTKATKELVIL